jgi:hypothetical protein
MIRLIPLTPLLPCHFTIPLINLKNIGDCMWSHDSLFPLFSPPLFSGYTVTLSFNLKHLVQPKKRGVKMGINRFISTSYTIADAFYIHLNGYYFALNLKKPFSALRAQKTWCPFAWRALPKTQKRVVTLRDSPVGDTSNAATVAVTKCDVSLLMEKIKNIFSN